MENWRSTEQEAHSARGVAVRPITPDPNASLTSGSFAGAWLRNLAAQLAQSALQLLEPLSNLELTRARSGEQHLPGPSGLLHDVYVEATPMLPYSY